MKTNNLTPAFVPLHPVLAVAAMNLFLLFLLVLIFFSSLAKPSGFEIRMPRAVVSEGLQGAQTITITAENVLYLNGKVIILNELKRDLAKVNFKDQNIFIRADRRSSMGRVMDVWDLCRALGGSRVHILASEEEK
ncbi:MAG: biopolymer transporter ExbD [Candidatus Omnitrophica bacterium]|nr:biopolymer transporter ExbD [Candidatus Omnitrophota bacterium]